MRAPFVSALQTAAIQRTPVLLSLLTLYNPLHASRAAHAPASRGGSLRLHHSRLRPLRPRSSRPQRPQPLIHGRVINPSGAPQKDGTVSLSVDGGVTLSYNFPVSSNGEYSGQAPPGEYTIVYRAPDTPEGKIVDYISGVVRSQPARIPRRTST